MTSIRPYSAYVCENFGKKMNRQDSYKILTLTHQQANLQQIGRFVINDADTDDALQARLNDFRQHFGWQEVLYLSTCNRILFLFYTEKSFTRRDIPEFFGRFRPDLTSDELAFAEREARLYEGQEAMQHLFEVGASMNSLVVGEREILRQLREAFDKCQTLGTTGDNLRIAMRFAVEASKAVYSRTRIGEKPVSVVSLAVHRLLELKPSRNSRILLVGAGQTNVLVSKLLHQKEFKNFTVFNRSLERAQSLAKTLHGEAYTLEDLPNYKGGFDIMIVCTGATQAVVSQDLYRRLLNGETGRKIVIDLSIPNNVSGEVMLHHDVHYTEVEDLRQLAQVNLDFRQHEVIHAQEVVSEYLREFDEHFRTRQISLALSEVPNRVRAVKERAMGEIFRKELDTLDPETLDLVSRMMTYMERGCINEPMKLAKAALLSA